MFKQDITPATIGIIEGRVKAGMASEQINILGMPNKKKSVKVSRRDFPYVLSQVCIIFRLVIRPGFNGMSRCSGGH